jgi:hypothetical protein
MKPAKTIDVKLNGLYDAVSILIKGYQQIEMEDFIYQVMPEEIYNQLINGTYEIADV